MHVGVASGRRWLRWGSALNSHYDGTPARFVPEAGRIEWAGLLFVATSPPSTARLQVFHMVLLAAC